MKTRNAQLSRSSSYIFTVLCLSLLHLVQVKQIVRVKSTHQTLIRRKTLRFPRSFLSQNVTHRILNSYDRLILHCRKSNKSGFCSYLFFLEQRKKSLLLRLQNSPYFCVFKYGRAVKQKVWNDAENSERDWIETLKIRSVFFSPL